MKYAAGVWLVVSLVGGALSGCGGDDKPTGAAPTGVAPAPVTVAAERDGLFFRYVDPATGTVATAMTMADIPEPARGEVVVFDESRPTPAGWAQVVDLSGGFPVTSQPQEGFTLRVAKRSALKEPAAAGTPTVTMFSTQGCGYCRKARAWFAQNRVPITELDVERDPSASKKLQEMGRMAGMSAGQLAGVPIIFVGKRGMVGWDQQQVARLLGR